MNGNAHRLKIQGRPPHLLKATPAELNTQKEDVMVL